MASDARKCCRVDTPETDILEKFRAEFAPKLGTSQRWEAFKLIASTLLEKKRPLIIVETGCVRTPDNWMGDGQSTRVWDWLIKDAGGEGFSVDLDPLAVASAQALCPNMKVTCSDSLAWLLANKEIVSKADFVYLDSYDFHEPYIDSMLHHAAEFSIIASCLPKGCLIAIDDCHGPWWGKQGLVKGMLELMGTSPILESYVTVWQKP